MRNQAVLLTILGVLLGAGSRVHAQQRPYDITNCESDESNQIVAAVDAALDRLNKIKNAPQDLYNAVFTKAFGDYSQDEDAVWAFVLVGTMQENTRALLTGTQGINPFGDPPQLPRLIFNCTAGQFGSDIAHKASSTTLDLFPLFFEVPHTGHYDSVQGSRVGTVLHEAVHILGGPQDIKRDGNAQDVQAEILATTKDPAAISNAENYERFYMSFIF